VEDAGRKIGYATDGRHFDTPGGRVPFHEALDPHHRQDTGGDALSDTITETELSAEYARLDAMRKTKCRGNDMTDEQFQLVHYARTGIDVVSFADLARWWRDRGWGVIKDSTIKARYYREKLSRGL
jgi:hypothetical protein